MLSDVDFRLDRSVGDYVSIFCLNSNIHIHAHKQMSPPRLLCTLLRNLDSWKAKKKKCSTFIINWIRVPLKKMYSTTLSSNSITIARKTWDDNTQLFELFAPQESKSNNNIIIAEIMQTGHTLCNGLRNNRFYNAPRFIPLLSGGVYIVLHVYSFFIYVFMRARHNVQLNSNKLSEASK